MHNELSVARFQLRRELEHGAYFDFPPHRCAIDISNESLSRSLIGQPSVG